MPIILGHRSYAHNPYIPFHGNVIVGRYTSIAEKVTFLCGINATHPPAVNRWAVSNYNFGQGCESPSIYIGSDVWIGTRAIIMGGVTIGHGAIVGAGCVCTKDVPPYAVCVGSPPVIKKYRFDEETIANLLEKAWWNWSDERVEGAMPLFGDVRRFL